MNYYIDTEFLEGTQKKRVFGIPYGDTKPTIDLISIGIVAEDGREYYAISKDFNLKEAWERYDLKETSPAKKYMGFYEEKVYWIRENVLRSVYEELLTKEMIEAGKSAYQYPASIKMHTKFTQTVISECWEISTDKFKYKTLKRLISKYGKTNKQIAIEIKEFVGTEETIGNWNEIKDKMNTQFYGYYCDYDWVVFCWLFGKMNDLPNGFPMYCRDLKQELDEKANSFKRTDFFTAFDFKNEGLPELVLEEKIEHLKKHVSYPKQTNEHNALADAKWNLELHKFLNSL